MSTTIKVTFVMLLEMLNRIGKKIMPVEYNPAWANGTGYFNGATKFITDDISQFKDESGRNGLIIPFKTGNLVVFERYSEEQSILVVNHDINLKFGVMFNSQFNQEDLRFLERLLTNPHIRLDEFKFETIDVNSLRERLEAIGGSLTLPQELDKAKGKITILPLPSVRFKDLKDTEDLIGYNKPTYLLKNAKRKRTDDVDATLAPDDIMIRVQFSSEECEDWNRDFEGYMFPKYLPLKFLRNLREEDMILFDICLQQESDGSIDVHGQKYKVELEVFQKRSKIYNNNGHSWGGSLTRNELALLEAEGDEATIAKSKAKEEKKRIKEEEKASKPSCWARMKFWGKKNKVKAEPTAATA